MKLPFKLPQKIEQRNRVMGFVIGLALALVVSALYLAGPLRTFDNFDLDFKFRTRHALAANGLKMFALPTSDDIIFVDIDDLTLEWEETFPDDPRYYVPIIQRLGRDQLNARAVVFTFDYSQPYGRRVVPDAADGFRMDLETLSDTLGDRASMVDNLMNISADPGFVSPDQAPIIASKLDELLTPEASRSKLKLPALDTVTRNFKWILRFLDEADLNDLAPNREHELSITAARANNVYFINSSKAFLETPYTVKDLKTAPGVRDVFMKIILRPTSNRPDVEKDGLVYDAYQNLTVDELEYLLARDKDAFPDDVRKNIMRDMAENKAALKELYRQGGRVMFDLPDAVRKTYVKKRYIEPAQPAVGQALAGMGVGSAEFSKHDGTLRMIAPAMVYDNKLFPHIDLLIAMDYFGVDKKNVVFEKRRVVLKNARDPRSGKTRDVVIPLTPGGTMLINWAGVWADTTTFEHRNLKNLWTQIRQLQLYEEWQRFEKKTKGMTEEQIQEYRVGLDLALQDDLQMAELLISNKSLISEEQAAAYRKSLAGLKGKILLVGRTAVGTAEINPMPLEPRYHYVGLHANAVNTILNGLFIHRLGPAWVVAILLALGVALGFVGGMVQTKSSFLTAVVNFFIMIVFAAVYTAAAVTVFGLYNLEIPFLIPLLLIVLVFLAVFLFRFITEEREKNRMKGMFSTYVNKEVVDSLIDNPDKLRLGGEWLECTVFFSDVAGFTSISESLKPEELVELLNEYLTAMTDIVFTYGGTLDKYIGDAIVAIYGAPIPFEDHAKNACLATIDMQRKLAEMRTVWREQGRHELTARCGINTGKMIAGNMGSKTRFNYTVMGDHCELGEHLESGGKTYGTIMTISERTRELAGSAIQVRKLDCIKYGGIPEPMFLFEIICKGDEPLSEDMKKGIALHEEALMLYLNRQWDAAIAKYNEVFQYIPDDEPTTMALGRVKAAQANPPGPEFDELLAHANKSA